MTRPTLRLLLAALALLAASACSQTSSPTAPTPSTTALQVLGGSWVGTIATAAGEVSVRMTLQARVDGDVERATGAYEARLGSATATGDVTGATLLGSASILLTPSGPPRCPSDASSASAGSLLFTARPDGNRLSGAGTWTQCAVSTQVAVVLTKN
ncbi:MAG: hypothetical protein U0P30_02190 [Vicinamibacterales bacterium]